MPDRNSLERASAIVQRDGLEQLFRARVDSNDGNQVYIIRDDATARDGTSYPKASGLVVAAGDEVLVARVGSGSFVVICKLVRN